MKDYPDVDSYVADSDQWPEELAAIRPILLSCGLDESIKWGKPCYGIDGGDTNVVLLQEFTKHLALLFFQGVLLEDPERVLRAQGPNTHGPRRMEFTSVGEIESLAEVITAYVNEAIQHARAGTELPPRPDEELAVELQERLAIDPELADAFHSLTPGRQREYNLHISDAKQSATRDRRIDKVVPRILEGRGLRDR
ncbi:MAG: YdeI/OmpD-associated family protein [Acidimicrobiales bacterium]|nr:YdeI/OmpD-associated family protein [Acidimicrobiales bacterium]